MRILAVLNRCGNGAGRRFLQMAVALTALSCVPSIALPDDTWIVARAPTASIETDWVIVTGP